MLGSVAKKQDSTKLCSGPTFWGDGEAGDVVILLYLSLNSHSFLLRDFNYTKYIPAHVHSLGDHLNFLF